MSVFFTASGSIYESYQKQFDCKKISIRSEGISKLIDTLTQNDVVVHNAASIATTSKEQALKDNFELTKNLVDKISESKKNVTLIFISSMSILENENTYKYEKQMTDYAFSKYRAEQYCLNSNINCSCVRFSTLFYGNPSKDGLSKMIEQAYKNESIELINEGKDTRDFIPLDISTQYLHQIILSSKLFKIYNIAATKSTSFNDVAFAIKSILPNTNVSNKNIEFSASPVLSTFTKTHLHNLKCIDFNLKDYINKYIIQLSESNSI